MVERNWTSPRRRNRSASHDSPLEDTKKKVDDDETTTADNTVTLTRQRSKSMGDYLDLKKKDATTNKKGSLTSNKAQSASKKKSTQSQSASKENAVDKEPKATRKGRSRSRSDASASKLEAEETNMSKVDVEAPSSEVTKDTKQQETSSRSDSDSDSVASEKVKAEDTASSSSSNKNESEENTAIPKDSDAGKCEGKEQKKKKSESNPKRVIPIAETLQKQKQKQPKNELSKVLPGYTAPLRLMSSLDHQRPGLEALRKKALKTDKTTAAFVKGTLANQNQTRGTFASKPAAMASSSFKMGVKREAPNNAGDKWFGMTPTPMTEELKRDLSVIRNRNYLDPKRFYKSSDKTSKYIQVGTVVEGTTEYYSSRLTKKQRRSNLTEEIMADPASADYARNKYRKMQLEKDAQSTKRQHKKKRGKRQHL